MILYATPTTASILQGKGLDSEAVEYHQTKPHTCLASFLQMFKGLENGI